MYKVMDQAFSLLWNMLEENSSVLDQFNRANILEKHIAQEEIR